MITASKVCHSETGHKLEMPVNMPEYHSNQELLSEAQIRDRAKNASNLIPANDSDVDVK